jgi:hypothetical protein
MLESRIMNRRTTLSAPAEELATLEREAQRRGVALTVVLAEAVRDKAEALRSAHRPRVGVARSTDGRSASALTGEPVAHPPR